MKHLRLIKICIFLFLSALTYDIQAQKDIPEENLNFPVLIEVPNIYPSTGFFFNNGIEISLITARHVIFDSAGSLLNGRAFIKSLAKDPKEKAINSFEFLLDSLLISGEIRAHQSLDVVVINFGKINKLTGRIEINKFIKAKSIAQSGILCADITTIKYYKEISIGNTILVQGYPSSLGLDNKIQFDHSHPLLRKGIIAGKFDSLKTIVLDCPVYYGNSGSPVLEISHYGFSDSIRVIGVISEWVPFNERIANRNLSTSQTLMTNSGYSIAIPIDAVMEILGN